MKIILTEEQKRRIFNEDVYPHEVSNSKSAIRSLINKQRNVGWINLPKQEDVDIMNDNNIESIPVPSNPYDAYVIYLDGYENEAKELVRISQKYNGFLSPDATDEETYKIGRILGYPESEIEDYIKKNKTELNEELIGQVSSINDKNEKYNVIKNPISLKRISPQCRGFVDYLGNLYIVDNTDDITHYDLSQYLNMKGYPIPALKKSYLNFDKVVPVIRYKNTNNFYIGEGFTKIFDDDNEFKKKDIDDFLNKIQKILQQAEKVNPNYTFNIESIGDVEFF